MRRIFFDVQTTGLSRGRLDVPIQIAACDMDGDMLYDQVINSFPLPADPQALALAGLSADDVRAAPRFIDELPNLRAVFDNTRAVYAGYNVAFDYQALINAAHYARDVFPELATLDVMVLYSTLALLGAPAVSLRDACLQQGIAVDEFGRGALANARLTARLYACIMSDEFQPLASQREARFTRVMRLRDWRNRAYLRLLGADSAFIDVFSSRDLPGYPVSRWLASLADGEMRELKRAVDATIRLRDGRYRVVRVEKGATR